MRALRSILVAHPTPVHGKLFAHEYRRSYDASSRQGGCARDPVAGQRQISRNLSRQRESDPVGACVGNAQQPCAAVVASFKGEKIDHFFLGRRPTTFSSMHSLGRGCQVRAWTRRSACRSRRFPRSSELAIVRAARMFALPRNSARLGQSTFLPRLRSRNGANGGIYSAAASVHRCPSHR